MRQYIFIKDEAYSSNLHTNSVEFLQSVTNNNIRFAGSEVYKIKLMNTKEANLLQANHPMMIGSEIIKTKHGRGISLVSFGGTILEVPIDKMMYQASEGGISILASFKNSNKESEILKAAEVHSPDTIKDLEGLGFIYLTMLNLEGTDLYYLITNPTLVQSHGHIEIEDQKIWIQQIKGKVDTLKDSIFPIKTSPQNFNNNIFSGGFVLIDFMDESIIQKEDRDRIFGQLKMRITNSESSTALAHEEGTITIVHKETTPVRIEIENKILPGFLNKKEELKWEYILNYTE